MLDYFNMFLSWREKRKYLIFFILIIFILLYLFYKFYPNIFPVATCLDKKMNGLERGIDCGGSCQLICPIDVIPFISKFSKVVESEKDLYDLVALVTNKNKDKNTIDGKINYLFTIYDKSGEVIQNIHGSTTIPIGQDFPIILQNIYFPLSVSGNSISNISFKILNNKVWYPVDPSFSQIFFKTLYTNFKNGKGNGIDLSRISVQIQNLTKNYFRNIPVRVILYDKDENVLQVNETLIDEFESDQIKTISFTWRNIFKLEPARIDVYPIVTPYTYFK